jgi:hypothetical protein
VLNPEKVLSRTQPIKEALQHELDGSFLLRALLDELAHSPSKQAILVALDLGIALKEWYEADREEHTEPAPPTKFGGFEL